MNANNIAFGGVNNVAQLFANIPSDAQIKKLFRYSQTTDLARVVGAEYKSRSREEIIIGAIRERFESGDIVVAECKCEGLGEGRRWVGADDLIPVRYRISPSVEQLFKGAEGYAHEAMQFVSSMTPRLALVPAKSDEIANIAIAAGPYDGEGSTLGITSYYVGNDDDLDVFNSRQTAVNILIDTAENWTADYFRTVFRHEVFHAVGLDHADIQNDLMYAYYLGVRLGHPGAWTGREMDLRYLLDAAA